MLLRQIHLFRQRLRNRFLQKENIYTIPNLLTSLRIAVTPYLGYLVLAGEFDLGFKIFLLAGLSDFLDGFIARNFENQQSVLGSALDPFADKLLVSILTITLTMAELLPVPLTCLIIGRDALLICAGFYLRYITLPPPRNLKRYFDVSHATVTLLPSTLSKWNTGLQLCLIAASMAAPVFGFVDHLYLQGLWYLTGATTVGSGIQYVVNRNKYIKFTQEKLKRKI
ncbi:cardiolipin synthase (CMP-forming)-like isoform X2 [Mizuhopecten yessoensis]|uniref:cardiolipin synthase (CMP-forming)-like isoform X2 n=1 Tax=Mizuhopecten yessoensis TaxID=6573 RepID=UPI000B4590AD|nr:cardiolipin synthase (CMP-forming)-like isoform X2 [Mizuhopecten yessoensis]